MVEDYSHLPKTRAEAKRIGSTRYFTGEACGKGHIKPRKTSNGNCLACLSVIKKRYAQTERGRERQSAHSLAYRTSENGRAVRLSLKAERRAAEKLATPAWFDRESSRSFYRHCPKGHHVDHIIPLANDNVCGLHVLDNFQYLPRRENVVKSNKVDPLTLEANVCVLPAHRSYIAFSDD